MAQAVVLLRAVNLGPRNRLAMSDFRAVLEAVGCTDVTTYVQSGNAVVTTRQRPAALETAIADRLRSQLDLPVDVLVRTADELDAVVAGNPFAAEELPPTSLHVAFLAGDPPQDLPDVTPDRIVAGNRVLYIAYARSSQSSAAGKALSRKSFPLMTARNWRTVLALHELAHG